MNAAQYWTQMQTDKNALMSRVERLSTLTLPHICLPLGLPHETTAITNDFTSIGAQLAGHITNKLGLTLFRPGVPFFRLGPDKKGKQELQKNGLTIDALTEMLSDAELEAVKELDRAAVRPKLNIILEHLVVTGNVLMCLEDDTIRAMGLRYYCVKRNYKGEVIRIVIREEMCKDELEDEVQGYAPGSSPETKVCWYKLIQRKGKRMVMTQYIGDVLLPEEYNGSWTLEDCPYRPCVWLLPDDSNYGIGLCQQYWADLETASALSESVSDGSILGTEVRWGVDPTSMTRAEDLNKSKNGDFVSARKEDINAIYGGNPEGVQVADSFLQRVERRLSMGFLMQSAITRNAERVTAEEVRMQALELETSYGGVYTGIAKDVQGPVARWTLKRAGIDINGTGLQATVITGLDALTRNAELESLRAAFSDMALTAALPDAMQARIKWKPLGDFIGAGRGVKLSPFLMSEEEFAQSQQAEQQSRVAEQSAIAGGQAAADAAINQENPQ